MPTGRQLNRFINYSFEALVEEIIELEGKVDEALDVVQKLNEELDELREEG